MANLEPFDDVPDLRHKVRRLNWFRRSLENMAEQVGRRYGVKYAIDDRDLLFAFFAWAARFEDHRKDSGRNRRDFSIFAGGLMLFELLRVQPVRYTLLDGNDCPGSRDAKLPICRFWPDGFLYTHYCLSIVRMILEQDFSAPFEPPREHTDLRAWTSFRENFRDDPALAVAFFDVFMGVTPNWTFPQSFLTRPRGRRSRRIAGAESASRSALTPPRRVAASSVNQSEPPARSRASRRPRRASAPETLAAAARVRYALRQAPPAARRH